MTSANLAANWYLYLPSWVLAALIVLLLVQLVLTSVNDILTRSWATTAPVLRPFIIVLTFPVRFVLTPFIIILMPVRGAINPVLRVLAAITRPVVATVGAITPRIVPQSGVLLLAMVWLAALRVAVFWVAVVKGVRL
jgi:hypothetical protein